MAKSASTKHPCLHRQEEGANFLKNRQQMKMSELDEQLAEYIAEWRKQRGKEEDELRKLKEKQARRKVSFRSLYASI